MSGQQPSITPATQIDLRPSVVRDLFGLNASYSSLSSGHKEIVDRTGNEAFMEVTERAKYFAEIKPDTQDLPTQWNELFRAMWVAKGKLQTRSVQDFNAYWTQYVAPLQERIADHYTANWLTSSVLSDDNWTVDSIRRSVVARLVRQRTPVFAPMREVDAAIRIEFVKLWDARKWEFRKQPIKVRLTTDGHVLAADDTKFDGMASRNFVVKTTGSGDRSFEHKVEWRDASRIIEIMSYYEGQTGRPRYFYDADCDSKKGITLLPKPDVEYFAFAVVYVAAPEFDTATSTAALRRLPEAFRGHLVDRVFARLMSDWGREDGDAMRAMRRIEKDFDELLVAFDDRGASRSAVSPRGHIGLVQSTRSYSGGASISPMT